MTITVVTCPSKPNGSITRPMPRTRIRSSPNVNATIAWSSGLVGGSRRRMSAAPMPPSDRKTPKPTMAVPTATRPKSYGVRSRAVTTVPRSPRAGRRWRATRRPRRPSRPDVGRLAWSVDRQWRSTSGSPARLFAASRSAPPRSHHRLAQPGGRSRSCAVGWGSWMVLHCPRNGWIRARLAGAVRTAGDFGVAGSASARLCARPCKSDPPSRVG